MNCNEFNQWLDQRWEGPGASLPPGAREHVARCRRCAAVFELLRNRLPQESLPPGLQSRLEKSLLGSLTPVSPRPPHRVLVVLFLAIFSLLSLAGVAIGGVAAVRVMTLGQLLSGLLILGAGALLLALSLSWQVAPGSYHRFSPSVAILATGAAFLLAAGLLFPWKAGETFFPQGFHCLFAGALVAAPAALGLWILASRAAILSPPQTVATIGALAGLAGALGLLFGCIVLEAPHLIVWHAGVPIASGLAGFLVGKAWAHRRSTVTFPSPRANSRV